MKEITRIFWEFKLLVVILFAPLLLAVFLAWFVPLIGTEPPDAEVKQVIASPSVSQSIAEPGPQEQKQEKASVFVDLKAEAMEAAITKSKKIGHYEELTGAFPLYLLRKLSEVHIFYDPNAERIVFNLGPSAELSAFGKAQIAMRELLEGHEDVVCGLQAFLYRDGKPIKSGGETVTMSLCFN